MRARQRVESRSSAKTVRQLGNEIGTGWRHHSDIDVAGKINMGHAVVDAIVPQVGKHRPAGKRLHGHRCDELACSLRHHHLHLDILTHQQTYQLRRLVSSHAAGDTQQQAFFSQIGHNGLHFT